MASNWGILNFRDEGIEELYPILFATKAEAEARRAQLIAGSDRSYYDAERGDLLDVTFIEDEEFDADDVANALAEGERNANRIDGYDRDDLGESPDF